MRTIIHFDKKYVSIWLTRLEAQDEKVRELLKPIYQDYKKQGYQVVVFESGTGALVNSQSRSSNITPSIDLFTIIWYNYLVEK